MNLLKELQQRLESAETLKNTFDLIERMEHTRASEYTERHKDIIKRITDLQAAIKGIEEHNKLHNLYG